MDERGIMIADRDAEFCSKIAEHFRKAGYQVETTDSAVHVLCSILEKRTPVLLLGSDFDKKICSADLIHLLKKCNRHLHVIMVSDEMPLAQARKVRQEGIFYHALKPVTVDDTEELGLAVKCAFEGNGAGAGIRNEEVPQSQPLLSSCDTEEMKPSKDRLEAATWMLALVALICSASYFSFVAAQRAGQGSETAVWLFLGFCSLIIATQLLPIFRIKLPVKRRGRQPEEREESSLNKE